MIILIFSVIAFSLILLTNEVAESQIELVPIQQNRKKVSSQ